MGYHGVTEKDADAQRERMRLPQWRHKSTWTKNSMGKGRGREWPTTFTTAESSGGNQSPRNTVCSRVGLRARPQLCPSGTYYTLCVPAIRACKTATLPTSLVLQQPVKEVNLQLPLERRETEAK